MSLLESVSRETGDLIDREAGHLAEWFGEIRITPRFRTPLEKALLQ